jgi:hypothetical protein
MMSHEAIAAYLGLVMAIISLVVSLISNSRSNTLQRTMFKKGNVIDLALAWKGVNTIDPQQLITPDVVNAVNALDLTASMWNHDILEKEILMQSYWPTFRDLYDALYTCNQMPPGIKKTCRDCITADMTRAYEEMKQRQIEGVKQTTT